MMKDRWRYLWVAGKKSADDPSNIGLIQLAFPILLEFILRSLVNLVDVAFLARVSDSVVSAVSVGSQFIQLAQIITSAVATGTLVCLNQAIGMKKSETVNLLATIAIGANLIFGLAFGFVFLGGSEVLLGLMSLDAEGMRTAAVYMRICGGCMVFQALQIVINAICRSMGKRQAPLIINLVSNVINVIGNYIAIFHPEILGLEPVAGVALASVLSIIGGLAMGMVIMYQTAVRPSVRYLRPFPAKEVRLALSIGIPGGINNISYSAGQLLTTAIISMTGTIMVAAKVYVTNLVHYVALVGMAMSQASTLMVGYKIGEGKIDEVNDVRSLVTGVAVVSNMFFSLILFAFRTPLLNLFTTNSIVLDIATGIFLIDFLVEIGRALNNSIAGALQAAGDVKYQMVVNQTSAWIISVGGSYVLGILLDMKLMGVWIAFAADELIRGFLLLYRWRSQKWVSGAMERRRIISTSRKENA